MGSGRSVGWGLVALVAATGVGCEGMSGHHSGVAGHGGGIGGVSGSGMSGSTGGGVAGTTGSGVAGTTGSGVAGTGASGPAGSGGSLGGAGGLAGQGGASMPSTRVGNCGAMLALSSDMRLAPAAPGQRYLRCGTIGPERDWKIV